MLITATEDGVPLLVRIVRRARLSAADTLNSCLTLEGRTAMARAHLLLAIRTVIPVILL